MKVKSFLKRLILNVFSFNHFIEGPIDKKFKHFQHDKRLISKFVVVKTFSTYGHCHCGFQCYCCTILRFQYIIKLICVIFKEKNTSKKSGKLSNARTLKYLLKCMDSYLLPAPDTAMDKLLHKIFGDNYSYPLLLSFAAIIATTAAFSIVTSTC